MRMKPIPIASLPENLKIKALAAFRNVADTQRGEPERLGGAYAHQYNKGLTHARGLYLYQTEHVGDISHRMSQNHCDKWHYGYEWAGRKIDSALRDLRRHYGFSTEVEQNIRANYKYETEQSTDAYEGTFEQFVKEFEQAADRYAAAHSKVPVYNAAQFHAREAAVALGQRNYRRAQTHLEALETHLDTDWEEYASMVMFDDAGNVLPYPWTTVSESVEDNGFMSDYIANTEDNSVWQNHRVYENALIKISPTDSNDIMIETLASVDKKPVTIHVGLELLVRLADKHGVDLEIPANIYSTNRGHNGYDVFVAATQMGFKPRPGTGLFRQAR